MQQNCVTTTTTYDNVIIGQGDGIIMMRAVDYPVQLTSKTRLAKIMCTYLKKDKIIEGLGVVYVSCSTEPAHMYDVRVKGLEIRYRS